MYSSLSKSYQWNMLNTNNTAMNIVVDILQNGENVPMEQLSTAINAIRNRLRSPIITQIINALKSGRLNIVYSDKIRVPLYLPFIVLQQSKGNFAGIVFLNHCDCTKGETEYNVDARKLKVSLESCYFALRLIELDSANNTKLVSPSIIRPATKIYIHTVAETINRKYSIKLDPTAYNQLLFMLSRYFIGTVLGYNPDSATMENYCMYNCNDPDLASIRLVNDQFEPSDFENIATFISKLVSIPELNPRIGKLNVSSLVQMYVNLYNAPMTLALETFSYLLYNIIAVINICYINNYHILKNIVGGEGSKLYGHLVAILGE